MSTNVSVELEMAAELLELERNHDALLQERNQLHAWCAEMERQVDCLRTVGASVCNSVLGASPSQSLLETRLRQLPEVIVDQHRRVTRQASFFGAQVALRVVASHHEGIDLKVVKEGYLGGLPEEDLVQIDVRVHGTAKALSRSLPPHQIDIRVRPYQSCLSGITCTPSTTPWNEAVAG